MKVSVLLICYNQENYIKDAIESILMQETDFEWELLIGDDSSLDGTAEQIEEAIQNNPSNCKVVTYFREKNIGASQNLFELIKNAKGEYITVLEGDDYWLDQKRLQTLADFLDDHSEYIGVSYKRERRRNGEFVKYDPEGGLVGKPFTLQDYFDGKRFSAMACLFHNIYTKDYEGYEYLYTGARNACDQIMCYSILFAGDIFILNRFFGVYRIFSGGYCSQQSQMRRINDYLVQNRRLLEYYGDQKAIQAEIVLFHSEAVKILLKTEGMKSARKYYKQIDKAEKKGVLKATFKMLFRKIFRGRRK